MQNKTLPLLALAFLCILWGTVYPIIKIGVTDVPPFLYNTIRQSISGVLLVMIGLVVSKWKLPGKKEILKQLFPAILMITIGQGFVGWALMHVPSGLTALIISLMPVYVIVIEMSISKRFHFSRLTILGVMLGIVGMVIVFRENLQDLFEPNYQIGIILTLVAGFCWAGASIFIQRNPTTMNNFHRTGFQLLIGSVGLLIFTLVFQELDKFNGFTAASIFSLSYMIVMGSIAGFMIYFYTLSKLPMIQVSVVTYVNPLVAALVAWWFFEESITIYLIIAFGVTMIGVYLINRGQKL
ncbi:MAG: EamA family transporter [bacterium]|nr:EamA family transporter [bacterium]